MGKIILVELIFCFEIVKYYIVYALCSKQKVGIKNKKVIYILSIMLGMIGLVAKSMPFDGAYALTLFGAITLMFLNMEHKISNRIWNSFIIMMSVTALDSIFYNIYTKYVSKDLFSVEFDYLILDGFFALLLVGAYICRLGINNYLRGLISRRLHFFLKITSIIVDACLCLGGTHIIRTSNGEGFYFVFGIIMLLSAAFLGAQIVGMIDLNSRLNEGINQERLLREIQKEHYQSLIRKDKEIRKYRHDMLNHFMVIESYIEKGKMDSAKDYLNELKGAVLATTQKKYCVGHDVIDAISCYYLSEIEEFARITVRGVVSENIGISEMCLCTVYSNLLKNAVEELLRLKEQDIKNLDLFVEFKMGKRYFEIKIKNTAHHNTGFEGMNTLTSKLDVGNHGIGLSSIMYAIQKENGAITLNQDGGFVLADAVIPIREAKTMAI
ncbi:MAG: GHKL domain-containing protein [Butyrivibrio sp.]|nr:GHKL domain-containing protein [Butyrivibrio sp.]